MQRYYAGGVRVTATPVDIVNIKSKQMIDTEIQKLLFNVSLSCIFCKHS